MQLAMAIKHRLCWSQPHSTVQYNRVRHSAAVHGSSSSSTTAETRWARSRLSKSVLHRMWWKGVSIDCQFVRNVRDSVKYRILGMISLRHYTCMTDAVDAKTPRHWITIIRCQERSLSDCISPRAPSTTLDSLVRYYTWQSVQWGCLL